MTDAISADLEQLLRLHLESLDELNARLLLATEPRAWTVKSRSFWVMGLSWVALAVLDVHDESRHYIYVVRLLAFSLLLVGIIDRNRRPR